MTNLLHCSEPKPRAEALFTAIESRGLVRPGRTETEVDQDIYTLAERSFGVRKHWHKRIVRAGPNTVCVVAENPPVREIAPDDTVFLISVRCSMSGKPMTAAPM
jgi:Xaa-Pro dipeptidase